MHVRAARYRNGLGVAQDSDEILRLDRAAAEAGYAASQFNLAVMYANGEGLPQDHAAAVHWYRLAAEQGEFDAQYNLGLHYVLGEGVAKDDVAALKWFLLAEGLGLEKSATTVSQLKAALPAPDVAEAEDRARICLDTGYAECAD